MALLPVPTLSERHSQSSLSLGSLTGSHISLSHGLNPHGNNRNYRRVSIVAGVTEFQKRLQKRSSRREPGEYFSANVKRYRKYNPQNPTRKGKNHSQGKDLQNGLQDDKDTENKQSLAQHTTMMSIVVKLREIQQAYGSTDDENMKELPQKGDAVSECNEKVEVTSRLRMPGELILPKPNKNLFSIGSYWSTPDHPIPAPGRGVLDTKFPWEFDEVDGRAKEDDNKRVKPPTLAELMIPPQDLQRLRTLGIPLKNPLRIGRLGVTDNIADSIMVRWKNSELVKVKCEGPAAFNMLKIHRDLERKTGGLVIWRAGSVAVVYRGSDFDTAKKTPSSLERKLEGFITRRHDNSLSQNTVNRDEESVPSEAAIDKETDLGRNMHQSFVADRDPGRRDSKDLSQVSVGSTLDSSAHFEMFKESGVRVLDKSNGTVIDDPDLMHMQPGADKKNAMQLVQSIRKLNVKPDPFIEREYELEIESILEGLGPRIKDWKGLNPAPVDADLLPSAVANYRAPYRLLPYGIQPKLSNVEQTDLRRLVRHMAPHFVLGRNAGLQGLASAILKLWERSEVAKIAIKAGVQNTRSEKMAEELKHLTGGVLLARDKYFITLYRGKDFLPQQIAFALTERLSMLRNQKGEINLVDDEIQVGIKQTAVSTTEGETEKQMVQVHNGKSKRFVGAHELEIKLAKALENKEKAKKDLEKLESYMLPVDPPDDKETITEEERFMFRKLGLKMSAFLRIGRRGVFDGIVENMHLHWKHRELVKLFVKEKDPVHLQKAARMLEHASGGVLVAVVETSKGQVIIMYRGKNYQRPSSLRPANLLTKQKALARSLEMQRYTSISRHIQALEKEISHLRMSLGGTRDIANTECDVKFGEYNEEENDEFDGEYDVYNPEKNVHENEAPIGTVASGKSEAGNDIPFIDKKTLLELVKSGPVFRASPLTNQERLKLRKKALKLGVASRFNVGKSNVLSGLARNIRVHFIRHALVVIGVKNRGRGTSLQDLVHELEDLTGGLLVSIEPHHIIMYRGWPSGEKIPVAGICEEVSPELRAVLESEDDGWDLAEDGSSTKIENHVSNLESASDDYMTMFSDEETEELDSDDGSSDETYMSSDEDEGDDVDYDFTQLLESDDDNSSDDEGKE